MIMIYIFLFLSISLNGLLGWFLWRLLKKSIAHLENTDFLLEDLDGFVAHLAAVYELETFYGDETLKSLLDHSRQLKEDISAFKEIFLPDLEGEGENEEEDDYEEKED